VSPARLGCLLALALLATAAAPVQALGANQSNASSEGAELIATLPNPRADGDAGEWVTVAIPAGTNVSGWGIADGESVARLPNRTIAGTVLLTTAPEAVQTPPENHRVLRLSGYLALANAGERIELRADGAVLDTLTYRDAPEGEVYRRTASGWTWRSPGTTDLVPAVASDVPAALFVLPDAPSQPITAIASARQRVLLGAYTFASPRATRTLCAATDRGVDVRVLVDADPVGGFSRTSVSRLNALVDCGVRVRAIGGPGGRYATHHPKYAVVDDRALVLSENWKPAGTGGHSSRGWGVVLDSPRVADALAETFAADAGFRDVRPWPAVAEVVESEALPPANGSFPARFGPENATLDRVELLVAPDNAEDGIVALLDGAEQSVKIQQVSIGARDHPFVNATVRAARRGVSVSVLLSSAWYVREDNQVLVEWFDRLAREEGLPIAARLVTPRSRFEKSHVKAVLVDDRAAVVGSLNWNAHATRENREVLVVLHDPEAAAYYGAVFDADWTGGVWRLPTGVGVVTGIAMVLASVRLWRSVRFVGREGDSHSLSDGSAMDTGW